MKFERKKIAVALAYALGGTTLVVGNTALAVTVTVTGSATISASTAEALPVQIITREEIAKTGVSTTEELIADDLGHFVAERDAACQRVGQFDLRLLRRVAARPGQLPHAGADQWPPDRPVLQRQRHGRGQHQQHTAGGHLARRSPEGRRVRHLRRGCDRGRDQLHHGKQLPGRGSRPCTRPRPRAAAAARSTSRVP